MKTQYTTIELRSLIMNLKDDIQFFGPAGDDEFRLARYEKELVVLESTQSKDDKP